MTHCKNKHAAILGSRGGKATRARMTKEQASELGRKGALAMHAKRKAVKFAADYIAALKKNGHSHLA